MNKRIFTSVLSLAILGTSFGLQAVFAQTATNSEAARARAKVESLGNNTRVEVKLRDTTKVKGNLSNITPDAFTVADNKTGVTSTISYAEVAEIKKAGGGLSTRTWLILGAVAVGTVVTWIVVKPAFCDGGAQTRGIC